MRIEEIKELVAILEQSSLSYLEVTKGEFQLKLGKSVSAETAGPVETTVPAKSEIVEVPSIPVGGTPVTSPMVGVFYAAPSPESEPFVTVGQSVKKGQVVCIIEAMKLMNEIAAEKDGVITDVCVSNGDIVEFGQPLFYMK